MKADERKAGKAAEARKENIDLKKSADKGKKVGMKKSKAGKADKAGEVVNVAEQFSFEYLLLPPRSALGAVLHGITPKASSLIPTPAYSQWHRFYPGGGTAAADADMTIHHLIKRCATVSTCLPRKVLVLIWALREGGLNV